MLATKKRRTIPATAGQALDNTSNYMDDSGVLRDKVLQQQLVAACPPHPLGVRPEGNRFLDIADATATATAAAQQEKEGEGNVTSFYDTRRKFARFPDELLLKLCQQLPATILARLEQTSKAFYAFVRHEENWKDRVLDTFGGQFQYRNSWRNTFIATYARNSSDEETTTTDPVQVPWMYSDVLFRPWHYAPSSHNLSVDAFINEYERPNRPVIIADGARNWPALANWTPDRLLAMYGDTQFRAEKVDITLDNYWKYAEAQQDESPLYLFDRGFTERCTAMQEEFTVPDYFREDLFSHLGEEKRPDYRWLIVGPARSGSTFHKDPNATSAWNAVVSDESEVTAPVSVMEWFHYYYAEARQMKNPPLECVCHMFVPRGWWHCVVNLEFSMAVTQNYVSRSNLPQVLAFLRDRPDQISGLRGVIDEECGVAGSTQDSCNDTERTQMYTHFCDALIKAFPKEQEAADAYRLRVAAAKEKSSWWAQLRASEHKQSSTVTNDTMAVVSSNENDSDNTTSGFRFSFITDNDNDATAKDTTSTGFCFNFKPSTNELP
ncbi:hypothetical protein BDF22DRAFT_691202 [Syncephalis plumigaleata]|nr:hypothetical protein BDF22DRAFT_691202 [Syncephalis plumigaleata]